jgi:hypothetical protein
MDDLEPSFLAYGFAATRLLTDFLTRVASAANEALPVAMARRGVHIRGWVQPIDATPSTLAR